MGWSEMKTIVTERLTLRRFTPEDAEPAFRNWASDPEVTRYVTWPPHRAPEETRRAVEEWIGRYDTPGYYHWAIQREGECIGFLVAGVDVRKRSAAVGYAIGRAWWGQGLLPEALGAVIAFLFRETDVRRIAACHDTRNPNSGRVMQKCGMRYEGTWREAGLNNSGVCDEAWYSILRREFEE